MKLDNRPKKLLVKGASAESLQAVRDWYEVRTVVCRLSDSEWDGSSDDGWYV